MGLSPLWGEEAAAGWGPQASPGLWEAELPSAKRVLVPPRQVPVTGASPAETQQAFRETPKLLERKGSFQSRLGPCPPLPVVDTGPERQRGPPKVTKQGLRAYAAPTPPRNGVLPLGMQSEWDGDHWAGILLPRGTGLQRKTPQLAAGLSLSLAALPTAAWVRPGSCSVG